MLIENALRITSCTTYENPANTDRIARTVSNMAVCRAFLRSVHGMVYRPLMDRYRPLSYVPPAYRLRGNLLFSRSFSWVMVAAVGAGGILSILTGSSFRRA